MGRTVADAGEFGLIEQLIERFGPMPKSVIVGPGDDAAALSVPGGRIVVTTDLLIEGRHFRTDWSSGYDVGRRTAAANLADVVAMGAAPVALVIGVGVPPETDVSWVAALADGVRDECVEAGAAVVGGDTVQAERITVSGTAIGDLRGREPVRRDGAKVGDVVAVAGRLGWAAAGLTVLRRGFRSPRVLADAHRRPAVPYEVALAASPNAMADISDGLLADAGHIATASQVAIEIDTRQVPIAAELLQAAAAFNVDPLTWVLTGGDDHGFVATFAKKPPKGFVAIGRVAAGEGVLVDGSPYPGAAGFDHFRG